MIQLAKDPEKDLIARAQAGEEAAFRELFRKYLPIARSAAYGLRREQAEAEDIAQMVMIRAHRALNQFRGDCSFKTWIFRIATSLTINRYWYHRRRMAHRTLSGNAPVDAEAPELTLETTLESGEPSPAESLMQAERESGVDHARGLLKTKYQEILGLLIDDRLRYREIAARTGLNVGTVKSRIARARSELRRLAA